MEKIWILSELYFPEQTSTGYLLTKIAEGLAEDYEVKVITNLIKNCPQYELKSGVYIFRCQGTSFNRNSFWGRLANFITCSTAIIWKAFQVCKTGEAILVVTNPPILPILALTLKWVKKCKIVLLIHDIYPEVLVAAHLLSSSSLITKIGHLFNILLYNQANKIITLGRDMTKIVEAKLATTNSLENSGSKISLITHWAEHESVSPTDRYNNVLLKKLGYSERFVVLYAGNMGKTHGIRDLAEAARYLKCESNIHFLVLGFGAKKKWLEEYVASQGIDNISIFSLLERPRSEQSISLNAGDVALISFVPGMAGVSVPSRMYNQMAAGKPIIAVADDWSELAEVVREEEIGWVVQPGDIEGLVNTIKFAANHPEVCMQMGIKAAEVAIRKYSFAHTDQAYKKVFKELFASIKE